MSDMRHRTVKCTKCGLAQFWRERCRRCKRELLAPAADYVQGERVTVLAPNGKLRRGVVATTSKTEHFVNVLLDELKVVHTFSKRMVAMEIV